MGRPSKLTPELQQRICSQLEDWGLVEDICDDVGISDAQFYRWLNRGETEDEGNPHYEFRRSVRRARAKARREAQRVARSGDDKGVSNGPAKCAQWFLERTDKRFAPRLNVKLEEGLEALLDDVERVCSSKDCGCYEAILSAVSARETGGEAAGSDQAEQPSIH